MKQIIFSKDYKIQSGDEQITGMKAWNLFHLQSIGLRVPDYAVVPAAIIIYEIESNPNEKPETIIDNYIFDDALLSSLKAYFGVDESKYFAVRSSGIAEDTGDKSFAGQYETLLYVPFNEIYNAIKKVWKSAYALRVKVYNAGESRIVPVSIIIQEMIDADVAGVGFGINPLDGNRTVKTISTLYGLGEGLVSGELLADTFTVKENNIEKQIAVKTEMLVFDIENKSGVKIVAVPEGKQNQASLSDAQIYEVAEVLNTLYKYFHKYQDIEFAYKNNILYLLQARPITSHVHVPDSGAKSTIWDNSNIIESYPGFTLPLTFSFIAKMYDSVYRQFSAIMGIRPSVIAANGEVYANMLGHIYGRVYYNLNNWYNALALLPGFSINAKFMEKMMGVKESFNTEEPKRAGLRDYMDVLRAIRFVLYNLFTVDKQRREFLEHFNKVITTYKQIDFSQRRPDELMNDYLEFEDTLVKKWKAPLTNDFFCMIYFGLLQKLVVKISGDEHSNLHNDLMAGSGDIVSVEPVMMGLELVSFIKQNILYKTLFEEKDNLKIWRMLHDEKYFELKQKIDKYLDRWGDRTVGELKLETITYRQKPEMYIQILKGYLKAESIRGVHTEPKVRKEAELFIYNKLKNKPIKKFFFNYIMGKARYLVSNRENLRYERTRGFAMVRNIFTEIGNKFYAEHLLENAADIFYLTQIEIFGAIKGTFVHSNLKDLVLLRKQMYLDFEKMNPAERIKSYGPLYAGNKMAAEKNMQILEGDLKGIPCCAGVVKAKVRVLTHPSEAEGLDGDILVTSSTDPGWVSLFPTASGILVERGSLLSHSAIVSREMGIPCVVGISGLLQRLKTGDWVEMDGSTGNIKILETI
ncbi:MAG: PEP/pyruvate-binding domain-containing protein [Bacteroidota bacterium]|nr:PEP/pyruvate-binding domain-containing protein [Bacteroidota bacterium]